MNIKPIDQRKVTVLVDNVLDILSTTPKSLTGHIPTKTTIVLPILLAAFLSNGKLPKD